MFNEYCYNYQKVVCLSLATLPVTPDCVRTLKVNPVTRNKPPMGMLPKDVHANPLEHFCQHLQGTSSDQHTILASNSGPAGFAAVPPRLAPRSLAFTATFMAAGAVAAELTNTLAALQVCA